MQEMSSINRLARWMTRYKTAIYIILSCLITFTSTICCISIGYLIMINTAEIPPSATPSRTQVVIITRTGIASLTQRPTETFLPTYTTTFTPEIQTPALTDQATPSATVIPEIPIELIYLTERAIIGNNANIAIRTLPDKSCSIKYTTPAGAISKAQGLKSKISDVEGYCSWEWVIGSNTKPGTGHIVIYVEESIAEYDIFIEEE